MAQLTTRINLSAAQFPLLSELHGRTVIVGTHDQNATPGASLNPSADVGEIGIPQLYYAHNVLPTPQGYKSVGYFQFANPTTTSFDFVSVHILRDAYGNQGELGVTADGKLYMLRLGTVNWVSIAAPFGLAGKRVTTAFIRGVTYIYFANVGCFFFNFFDSVLYSQTLNGVNTETIIGIVGSNGYMIVYDVNNNIAWSSTLTPVDFVPSLITGAGGGAVEGAIGSTISVVQIYGGFIIFTVANAIACIFTSNTRFPFAFQVVAGCGGLSSASNATYQATDSEFAYVYTTSGLQAVNLRQAQFLLPAVTEFLSGSKFEDFNEVTDTLSTTTASAVLKKQMAFIADRYVAISYGINSLTHAIIFDTVLKRVGKLKIPHVAMFEFQLYDQTIYETPKKSIGVLFNDGTVKLVDTDIGAVASSGIMILGKFQYQRARRITLETVELENTIIPAETNIKVFPSNDGKTLLPAVQGYKAASTGLAQKYLFHSTAYNHSILLKGRFNAVSGEISFQIAGKTGLA